jgi:membrane protease YdiL (CAAX protease family)
MEIYEKKQELCPIELPLDRFFSIITYFSVAIFLVSILLANCFEGGALGLLVSSGLVDILAVAFIFGLYRSEGWPPLNPQKMHPVECFVVGVRGVLQLFLLLCAVNFLWQAVLSSLEHMFNVEYVEQPLLRVLRLHLADEWQFLGIILSTVVFAPIAEEVFFRYFLYRSLKLHMPSRRAMLLVAFTFALLHFNFAAFVSLLIVGIFLTIFYEYCGNLIPCILVHSLFNYISIVLTVLWSSTP